jgi:ribosomal protein S18 acetylase RimI-like enzyme
VTLATHPLDNPAWASLTGPHRRFGEVQGRAARYRPEYSPFGVLDTDPDLAAWADLAELIGPGASIGLAGVTALPPDDWEVLWRGPGVQLIDSGVAAAPEPEAVVLGGSDVAEMLDLVGRTKPGPFQSHTYQLGTYLGIRREGKLVAMAGERLHPPGYTEISAVCTDPDWRGQGFGTRLVLAIAHGIRARGEVPFLHAAADNTNAIRLYNQLGFTLRQNTMFGSYKAPGGLDKG